MEMLNGSLDDLYALSGTMLYEGSWGVQSYCAYNVLVYESVVHVQARSEQKESKLVSNCLLCHASIT